MQYPSRLDMHGGKCGAASSSDNRVALPLLESRLLTPELSPGLDWDGQTGQLGPPGKHTRSFFFASVVLEEAVRSELVSRRRFFSLLSDSPHDGVDRVAPLLRSRSSAGATGIFGAWIVLLASHP